MFIKQQWAYRCERLNYHKNQDTLDEVGLMNQDSSVCYIVYWTLNSNIKILQIKRYSGGGGGMGGGGRTVLEITYKTLSIM